MFAVCPALSSEIVAISRDIYGTGLLTKKLSLDRKTKLTCDRMK